MIPDGFRQALSKKGEVFPCYYVSRDGLVGSTQKMGPNGGVGTFHLLSSDNIGLYRMVNIRVKGRSVMSQVHVLVARSWIGMPNPFNLHVNHKDGNKRNNLASNLEWVTPLENARHASALGLLAKGVKNGTAVLNDASVSAIRLMHSHGWTQTRLAGLFGVSFQTISRVALGDGWKHLSSEFLKVRRIEPSASERIIALLKDNPRGLTSLEVESRLALGGETCSARMCDLVRRRLILRVGVKLSPIKRGSSVSVFSIAPRHEARH